MKRSVVLSVVCFVLSLSAFGGNSIQKFDLSDFRVFLIPSHHFSIQVIKHNRVDSVLTADGVLKMRAYPASVKRDSRPFWKKALNLVQNVDRYDNLQDTIYLHTDCIKGLSLSVCDFIELPSESETVCPNFYRATLKFVNSIFEINNSTSYGLLNIAARSSDIKIMQPFASDGLIFKMDNSRCLGQSLQIRDGVLIKASNSKMTFTESVMSDTLDIDFHNSTIKVASLGKVKHCRANFMNSDIKISDIRFVDSLNLYLSNSNCSINSVEQDMKVFNLGTVNVNASNSNVSFSGVAHVFNCDMSSSRVNMAHLWAELGCFKTNNSSGKMMLSKRVKRMSMDNSSIKMLPNM